MSYAPYNQKNPVALALVPLGYILFAWVPLDFVIVRGVGFTGTLV